MKQLGTEFKVGLFTLVAAIVIAYMFFVLSPQSFNSRAFKNYYTEVKDAAGIIERSHVKTNGVIIGKVAAVKLAASRTRLDLEVEGDVPIPEGSKVAIKEKGLLGDVYLEIIRPETGDELLADGAFIPPLEGQMNISALIGVAGGIGRDVKQVTESLAKVLGGADGEKNLATILGEVKGLVENSRKMVEENREDIRKIVGNFERTTAALRGAIGDRQEDLVAIVGNLRATTDALRTLVGGDNQEKLEKIIAAFDNTMQDVEVTAKNVRLVADKIEKGDGTLGRLIHDDRVLTDIEGAIKDIREVIAPVTKLQLTVDYHGELRRDKDTQHYFNTYFRTRPDKFYLLGFTDLHERVIDRVTETMPNGEPSAGALPGDANQRSERVTERERKAIAFNLQFGKRWGDAQLRFGLFESTGGLAADFFLLSDAVKLTFEAFDWRNDTLLRRRAHFKLYATMNLHKHLYAQIGVDDLTRLDLTTGKIQKVPNYYVGAGVSFHDQDLKTIFGAAAMSLK